MSIKTGELQALTSLKSTDEVIIRRTGTGTARATFAELAKFLTEQDNPVKTALSSKAALSAQQTVEKTSVSSRTETVAAADLPTYISKLPKLVTEYLTLKVTGELAEPLSLSYFYGPGRIRIEASGNFTLRNTITISYNIVTA